MNQTTKKSIAKGMIISGLLAIVLSGVGSFINRNEIENLSIQKRRLLDYNNQIYSIALENPSTYNQNVKRINDLEEEIKNYEKSNKHVNLYLIGTSALVGGIYFHPKDKNTKKPTNSKV